MTFSWKLYLLLRLRLAKKWFVVQSVELSIQDKVKVKLFVRLHKHHVIETWGRGSVAPRILNVSAQQEWLDSPHG
jgi:hypothetical protein